MTDKGSGSVEGMVRVPPSFTSVTVIMVVYNNPPDEIEAVLSACSRAAEAAGLALQAIIVNNDDRPGGGFAQAEVIAGQGNVGFAAGVKLAVLRATSSHCLIINPDCSGEWEPLHQLLSSSLVSLGGAIVPVLVDGDRRVDASAYASWTFSWGRFISVAICRLFLEVGRSARIPRWVKAPGAVMLLPTALAKELDAPFDPAFFLYGEDRDLSLRMRRASVPLSIERRATVVHAGGVSGVGRSDFIQRCQADSAMRIAFRRYGRVGLAMAKVDLVTVGWLRALMGKGDSRTARRWAVRRWRSAAAELPRLRASELSE